MSTFATNRNIVGILLIVFGFFGLLAAFVLTTDKITLLENPLAEFSCSINSVIDCKSVMQTWQSEIFGFPNMIIGLAGYAAVIMYGFVLLVTTKFKYKIVPILFLIGSFIAFCFSYWLVYQSIYDIKSLCPWCLLSAFSASIIFFAGLWYSLKETDSLLYNKLGIFGRSSTLFICTNIVWFVFWIGLIFIQFGESLFL